MDNNENKVLLSIKDLDVRFHSGGEAVHAVNGVTLSVAPGQALGLVGETGAGKTTIAKSIMRILPEHSVLGVDGSIVYDGTEVLTASDAEMRKLRGGKISMIFQDPMTALNPLMKVADQIAESIVQHQNVSKNKSKEMAVEILEKVGISADRAFEYPHQFSGGMKQRVVIAIAIACNPQLLIADEPTTALDVTIQAQVLDLIRNIQKELNTSLILITHDLGVVGEICDSVAVVYAGQIVEQGLRDEIFDTPAHPYTKGLFAALPEKNKGRKRLSPVEGLPPDPTNLPKGCPFSPRCPYATEACGERKPDLLEISSSHRVACHNLGSMEG